MQTYLDCYPCFLRQALSAARRVGASDAQQFSVLQAVLKLMQNIRADHNPPEIAYRVHRIVRQKVDVDDPFRDAKSKSTQDALALYPKLKQRVARSADPFDTAIRIAIAGNIIDFGVREQIAELRDVVDQVLVQEFAICDSDLLREKLERAHHVLFLGDNAGETVFDRVLIEQLSVPVIYAVKDGPILNDATSQDAIAAGLDQCATLVSNGTTAPGTLLSMCSGEFRQIFEQAPLIIAKGQANYETLSDAGEKVFCLLQVKCPVIARDIGAPLESIVVRQSIG